MYSFRGDAWKFYVKLRNAEQDGNDVRLLNEIVEMAEIEAYYQSLDNDTLNKIRYRMLKEKGGSGIIPIAVSSIPWVFFIVSKQLHETIFKEGYLWVVFICVYITIIFISVILHFRENAWAVVHTEIINDILQKREKQNE
ncbi:hypothetical protein ACJ2A9_01605 [Anaerobacillus sp. MEB173]|uniref:hypothetical protein n=1 Tax=Anaerobacillus sp. MEB173 TaxID=3383345 RepID=UPI003F9030F8